MKFCSVQVKPEDEKGCYVKLYCEYSTSFNVELYSKSARLLDTEDWYESGQVN